MNRLMLIGLAPLVLSTPALAQIDHSQHAAPVADPHAGHVMSAPAAPADPHAGHAMPAAPAPTITAS